MTGYECEPNSSSRPVTWSELRSHVSEDDLWVSISGRAYDVTDWVKHHPGGALVLMHAAGKDATQPFLAYHPSPVGARLKNFYRGDMERASGPFCRGLDPQVEQIFTVLRAEVHKAGLMGTRSSPYIGLAAFLTALVSGAFYAAAKSQVVAAALLTALFWQQSAFIGHDAGHNAITHSRSADSVIGLLVNVAVGIGFSWWKSTHNVHHTVVNTVACDPDIQLLQFMPLIASSEHFFEPVWSTYHQDWLLFDSGARCLISWQHLTFIPLLMIAKFGLYLQTAKQLLGGKAYTWRLWECAAQAAFLTWYIALVLLLPSGWQRAAFVFLSHAAFFILHLQICLSHFACPTSKDLPTEGWMTHQVRGTMNWSCPKWMDWFHGGLQFQIEHHLFPRMPRHNLRAASKLVKRACQEAGLHYHSPMFWQAVVETLQVLHRSAQRAKQQKVVEIQSRQRPVNVLSRAFI